MHAGTAHDPHRPRRFRCRRHAADQGQDPDRRRKGRGAAAARCRHRLHHHLQPADHRHAVSDRAAGDHAAGRRLQRQLDRRPADEADRAASDPGRRGAAQPRRARRIRRRYLAVHQRPLAHPQRRRRICPERKARDQGRSDRRRGFHALSDQRLQDRRRQLATRRCCSAAKPRCRRPWARRPPRSARKAIISTSRRRATTRAPSSRRWPGGWGFRPTRSPPSATCRTICAMFRTSGLSFAMGNAADDVKQAGDACHGLERGRGICRRRSR